MFEIVSALLSSVVGFVIGWVVRGTYQAGLKDKSSTPEIPSVEYEKIAQRIWDLTHEVSADVDLHQDRVRAADDVLRSSNANGETPIVLVHAVSQIVEANRDMQQQLDLAREKLQTQAEELQSARQSATTDPLTHLRNRRALDEHLQTRYELRDSADTRLRSRCSTSTISNDSTIPTATTAIISSAKSLLSCLLACINTDWRLASAVKSFAVVFVDDQRPKRSQP